MKKRKKLWDLLPFILNAKLLFCYFNNIFSISEAFFLNYFSRSFWATFIVKAKAVLFSIKYRWIGKEFLGRIVRKPKKPSDSLKADRLPTSFRKILQKERNSKHKQNEKWVENESWKRREKSIKIRNRTYNKEVSRLSE